MSLGSPLWLDEGDTTPSLPQFLHCLRALLRRSYSVAVVSVPAHLIQVSLGNNNNYDEFANLGKNVLLSSVF